LIDSSSNGVVRLMQHFISGASSAPFPEVSHGDGIYLWDTSGRRYLDGSSGAVVSNIGHNNARVRAAMLEQAEKVSFAYARVWESAANRELAARIIALSNWGYDSCFFVSGGSEGVEAALKLARQSAVARDQRSRFKVISRSPSYHGSTLAVLGITGDADFGAPFEPMFVAMPKVPAPLTYRAPLSMSAAAYTAQCAAALEECILSNGAESVLAFIMEPVGGTSTGALVSDDAYYKAVRDICDRHGVLLIFDEVMSGAGRTGRFLAAQHWPDCRPDIVVLAKGLSGGYAPLGAVLTSHAIVDDVRRMGGFLHGHTYAAHPQACAIGCAVLDELVDRDLIANAERMGRRLAGRLRDIQTESGILGDVRGRGLLCAVEIVSDKETKGIFQPEIDAVGRIRQLCADEGLMLLSRRTSGGRFGEWLMVCPPLIVDETAIEDLCGSLSTALRRFEDEVTRARRGVRVRSSAQ